MITQVKETVAVARMLSDFETWKPLSACQNWMEGKSFV